MKRYQKYTILEKTAPIPGSGMVFGLLEGKPYRIAPIPSNPTRFRISLYGLTVAYCNSLAETLFTEVREYRTWKAFAEDFL